MNNCALIIGNLLQDKQKGREVKAARFASTVILVAKKNIFI
jgi:hypothetical protein